MVFGYLALARLLRWRRYNAIHWEYVKKYQDETLTPEEVQRIIIVSTSYDMPLLLNYSLAFALFKTYAIVRTTLTLHLRALTVAYQPSISKLLSMTGEFKLAETVSKRYAVVRLFLPAFPRFKLLNNFFWDV